MHQRPAGVCCGQLSEYFPESLHQGSTVPAEVAGAGYHNDAVDVVGVFKSGAEHDLAAKAHTEKVGAREPEVVDHRLDIFGSPFEGEVGATARTTDATIVEGNNRE